MALRTNLGATYARRYLTSALLGSGAAIAVNFAYNSGNWTGRICWIGVAWFAFSIAKTSLASTVATYQELNKLLQVEREKPFGFTGVVPAPTASADLAKTATRRKGIN